MKIRKTPALTYARLREVLRYVKSTGLFYWKIHRQGVVYGAIAGAPDSKGYIGITIDGTKYGAHRLAVLYVNGSWPVKFVDHRDLNTSNNRWKNLRQADAFQNAKNRNVHKNNTSGFPGVRWVAKQQYWRVSVCVRGKRIHVGCFADLEDAGRARATAVKKHYGEFASA